MGIIRNLLFVSICAFFLIAGSNLVTASDQADVDRSIPVLENLSGDLFSPILQAPAFHNLNSSFNVLYPKEQIHSLKPSQIIANLGTGWQNITLPAVISEPGNYRVMNNYSASEAEAGLMITCSDVEIDGDGHTFRGIPQNRCFGLITYAEAPISNITITNYNTEECVAGIIFYNVLGGEISNTHHVNSFTGIYLGISKSVNISGNTVTGSKIDESIDEVFGIMGMDSTDISIESNVIANISPPDPEIYSMGLFLTNVTNSVIQENDVSGSRIAMFSDGSESVKFDQNLVSLYRDGDSYDEIFGIVAEESTDIQITSNMISGITPPLPVFNSMGIFLADCSHSGIRENNIAGPLYNGISYQSDEGFIGEGLNISDNRVNATEYVGVYVGGGRGIISNNQVQTGTNGITLLMDDSQILGNHILDNNNTGLGIMGTNLTLSHNILTHNAYNFVIEGDSVKQYLHHIDRTNLADGKPIVYIRESSGDCIGPVDNPAMVLVASSRDVSIQNITTGNNIAGIMLVNVTNATICDIADTRSMGGFLASWSKGCTISNFNANGNKGLGIWLQNGTDFIINRGIVSGTSGPGYIFKESNNITLNSSYAHDFNPDSEEEETFGILSERSASVIIDNAVISDSPSSGVYVSNTEGLTINNTYITRNKEDGIRIRYSSAISINNSIISGNSGSGISSEYSDRFRMYRSFVLGNIGSGFFLSNGDDNRITDNFFNNSHNVEFGEETSHSEWNSTLSPGLNIVGGHSLGGNFWASPDGQGFSDTHSDRGDGICNASFVLNGENTDYLPLAYPFEEIIPDFIADQYSGTPPLTVRFTDVSTGSPILWNWIFGDGTQSHEQNPVHTYTGIGRYSVILEVIGEQGKQGIIRRPTLIDVNSGRVTGPNGMLMVNSSPQNASVFLDTKFIGLTPLQAIGIPAGEREILITHDGYQNWTGTVRVKTNQITLVPTVRLRILSL